ncbi:Fe-S cluster assembly sulfur transfer protein SufU [Streptococcus cuniculipharyngis]|uniref:SUF system NifU family Fe-S cluster assembly protein n=1 Tax=Streptococcus cuniculipharyngis TaxID=1562651 RepID=A0A5C5SB04_9STRE|nr:SUF system NifU family Fe-S cluster assembly protein [Streptococcus cuniculipharyngis]TWS97431.1 SUF system NifU family Fe-S cluster assembly protein [Streptococcus cuniculipharyngis]
MAWDKLRQLYMEVITDHARAPHHYGELAGLTPKTLHNPTCGDVIHLFVKVVDDHVAEIAFQGQGCNISTASASMMTDVVVGKRIREVKELAAAFSQLLQGQTHEGQKALGDAQILAGVAQFPQRIKCASLAWQALSQILANEKGEENV